MSKEKAHRKSSIAGQLAFQGAEEPRALKEPASLVLPYSIVPHVILMSANQYS